MTLVVRVSVEVLDDEIPVVVVERGESVLPVRPIRDDDGAVDGDARADLVDLTRAAASSMIADAAQVADDQIGVLRAVIAP
jgi:hypothetical protein